MKTLKPSRENQAFIVESTQFLATPDQKFAVANWQPVRILVLLTLPVRLLTMPGFVESGDGLYFVRGVTRYATYELRPHWPGYPVYIWVGQIFNLFTPDPVLGLHLLAVLVSSLSIFPIAALAGAWRRMAGGTIQQSRHAALLAGLIWALIPLSWLTGSEIYSDGLALILALAVLWLSWQALVNEPANRWLPLAALLGGLMIGVRLSYFILLIPFVFALWQRRKSWLWQRIPVLTASLVILAVSCGSWFSWQLAQEGMRFFEAADRHLSGHYSVWGGSIFTDSESLTRPMRLLELTLVYGFGGWWPGTPLLRLPVTLLLGWLIFNGLRRLPRRAVLVAALWAVPYAIWVLISHDLTIARYSFPLVALLVILAANGLPTSVRQSYGLVAATVITLAVVSLPLALGHYTSLPNGQQIANYAKTELNTAQSVVLISQKDAAINFANLFLLENVPGMLVVTTDAQDFDHQAKELAAEGRQVYAIWPDRSAPANWRAVKRFEQPAFNDSLIDLNGLNEVWFYRYDVSRQGD